MVVFIFFRKLLVIPLGWIGDTVTQMDTENLSQIDMSDWKYDDEIHQMTNAYNVLIGKIQKSQRERFQFAADAASALVELGPPEEAWDDDDDIPTSADAVGPETTVTVKIADNVKIELEKSSVTNVTKKSDKESPAEAETK